MHQGASGAKSPDACIADTGQISHFPLPGCQVIPIELVQMRMPAGASQHLHQFDGCCEEIGELNRRLSDLQPLS